MTIAQGFGPTLHNAVLGFSAGYCLANQLAHVQQQAGIQGFNRYDFNVYMVGAEEQALSHIIAEPMALELSAQQKFADRKGDIDSDTLRAFLGSQPTAPLLQVFPREVNPVLFEAIENTGLRFEGDHALGFSVAMTKDLSLAPTHIRAIPEKPALPLYLSAHILTRLSEIPLFPASIPVDDLHNFSKWSAIPILSWTKKKQTEFAHIPGFQAMLAELDQAINEDDHTVQRIMQAWHAMVTSLTYYIIQGNRVP
jgi:hypothetical protein